MIDLKKYITQAILVKSKNCRKTLRRYIIKDRRVGIDMASKVVQARKVFFKDLQVNIPGCVTETVIRINYCREQKLLKGRNGVFLIGFLVEYLRLNR